MNHLIYCLLPMLFGAVSAPVSFAQTNEVQDAILFLTGETDIEAVDETEMERFWALCESPVAINSANPSRLRSSGLLSAYQIASLVDYRATSGDILSIPELAAIDGFGDRTADALRPFITLETAVLPGNSTGRRTYPRQSLFLNQSNKASFPYDGNDPDYNWSIAGKYRITSEIRYDAGLAVKKNYESPSLRPDTYSGYYSYYGRKYLGQVILGDYSLRFGQGLALWSGFSMSGVSTASSFWKRPSGISPSRSFSAAASFRGVAAELAFGKACLSLFADFPGFRSWCEDGTPLYFNILSGLNAAWYSRHGQLSVTAFCKVGDGRGTPLSESGSLSIPLSKLSADARFCIRGAELFGEIALDMVSKTPAVVLGNMLPLGDKWKTALSIRYIPEGYSLESCAPVRLFSGKKGEYGLSAGLFYGDMQITSDMACSRSPVKKSMKINASYPWKIADGIILATRLQEKLRSYGQSVRTDIRTDMKCEYGIWRTNIRGNIVYSKELAWLCYIEEGIAGTRGAAYLRAALFHVDSWDDRIYCYERDAPGTFNIPAFYGRGYSLAATARIKIRNPSLKLYFRAGWTDYPWKDRDKDIFRPSRAELKFQIIYDI